MIIKATKKHIPFIVKQLSTFKKVTTEQVVTLLKDPREILWVDDEKEIVFRLNLRGKINRVMWLIPVTEPTDNLFLVMMAGFMYAKKTVPSRANTRTEARFKSGRGCLEILMMDNSAEKMVKAYQEYFPGEAVVEWRWWDNSWKIIGTISGAINAVKRKYMEENHDPRLQVLRR